MLTVKMLVLLPDSPSNMIKIKCDYLGGAVAVPTEVIDKHLKLAPAASFKVLLFILRNPDGVCDSEQISVCTGLSVEDVNDCLCYWEAYGVISCDNISDERLRQKAIGNAKTCNTAENQPVSTPEKAVAPKVLPVKKPTQREIALRLKEEPTLTLIYNEAQSILGTFGYDTQALILMIYDYYGFPPEVIITLLQHQKCENKTSSAAIKSRAEDWAKRGIDTLDLVEKELLALEKISEIYNEIKADAGLESHTPTPRVTKYIRQWAVEWECPAGLIKYALEESNRVLSDANKLLKKWTMQGIKSPEQVQSKQKKLVPKEVKKTYNTDTIGKSSVLEWAKRYADKGENE